MNLIQQIQTTPKWKEFEEWYDNFNGTKNAHDEQVYWEDLSIRKFKVLQFPFQKGVFEKFIESQEGKFEQTWVGQTLGNHTYRIYDSVGNYCSTYSFEEALLWYFNN